MSYLLGCDALQLTAAVGNHAIQQESALPLFRGRATAHLQVSCTSISHGNRFNEREDADYADRMAPLILLADILSQTAFPTCSAGCFKVYSMLTAKKICSWLQMIAHSTVIVESLGCVS